MSIDKQTMDARALADDIYDRDANPEEIRGIAATLEVGRATFEERVALRAFLDSDDDMPAALHTSLEAGMLETLRAAYEKAGPDETELVVEPIDTKVWLGLLASLGGDRGFIAKLARKTVTQPTRRALRDLADMLGVSLSQVREHFAAGSPGQGLAGVEMKSSAKPILHAGETFESAVRSSSVPLTLKERWLKD